ncbi:atrial natriuretic peptide-converting enzyme-like [Tropilaelaps mercedesae]|uniref:Atrial natriuretic peptide-converting enzyme-like n=1 Tax=Tropilaelaps mercedesae TaxID=418985 RepID=A0A1V9Y205_9ACAR|nr:atrial natriuretic peptide-converting enzyme-like [Tropilaelaps mercedesae]
MSIILLTASAVLAIIHGAEVYRRKMAILDPDTFFYTLPDRRTGNRESSSIYEEMRPPSCEAFIIEPCITHLPYNYTGYPNLVGHNSSRELSRDLRLFREVMDGECYPLANLLLCRLLQPQCDPQTQLKLDPPCREFCEHFLHRCDASIPDRIRSRINCFSLTSEECTPRPRKGTSCCRGYR